MSFLFVYLNLLANVYLARLGDVQYCRNLEFVFRDFEIAR